MLLDVLWRRRSTHRKFCGMYRKFRSIHIYIHIYICIYIRICIHIYIYSWYNQMICNMCRYFHATNSAMISRLVGRDGRETRKTRRDKSGAGNHHTLCCTEISAHVTEHLIGRDGREKRKARRDKSGAMLREGLSRRRADVLLPLFARGTRKGNTWKVLGGFLLEVTVRI